MNVLIACEESQRVCIEFRKRGHNAFSCDIMECSGGHPEWHIQGDVLPLLNGHCDFETADGKWHYQQNKWDMIIAFPPCTHLAVSGARHFEKKREDGRQREGLEFFLKFFDADCEHVCVENPVNIVSGEYVKTWFPDIAEKYQLPIKPIQTIQPYMFGHPTSKKTCLWLKGLPVLWPTEVVEVGDVREFTLKRGKNAGKKVRFSDWYNRTEDGDRAKHRSKTFPGIAKAMAEQWG